MGEGRLHIPSPLLLSAHRTSWAYIKAHVLKLVGQARRRGQAKHRRRPRPTRRGAQRRAARPDRGGAAQTGTLATMARGGQGIRPAFSSARTKRIPALPRTSRASSIRSWPRLSCPAWRAVNASPDAHRLQEVAAVIGRTGWRLVSTRNPDGTIRFLNPNITLEGLSCRVPRGAPRFPVICAAGSTARSPLTSRQTWPRAMPNIPWSPWNGFTCTRSAPRPGEAVLGDGGTIITQDFDRYPGRADAIGASGRPQKGVVADRFARPHLVLRAGTGTATGRPALCTTAANRHSQPACSPYPGRWLRLAGTSACTAVRGRSVLRCSGLANHQDPVTPPNLPGGKPGSGPPLGRKFSEAD
jgi:hypothetical protein